MKALIVPIATTFLVECLVITNSCSQSPTPASSPPSIFVASTPCDDLSKKLLGIPADRKSELMKWNLSLSQDPVTFAPLTFKLTCVYRLPKQGTRGFMEGASTIELKGKWRIGKGLRENAKAVIYTLDADNAPISLSFLKPDQNLLHLLDEDKRLMVGNGAWSYTLNAVKPVPAPSGKLTSQPPSASHITGDSSIVGIFDGRTPCNHVMTALHGISVDGCQIIKYRLTLYQDPVTHMPTTYQLHTVYVGKGDNRYTATGKWIVIQGTNNDPDAVVYQLELYPDKPQESLTFLKADNNILFFLDKDRNHLVGNDYTSYTLNRVKK